MSAAATSGGCGGGGGGAVVAVVRTPNDAREDPLPDATEEDDALFSLGPSYSSPRDLSFRSSAPTNPGVAAAAAEAGMELECSMRNGRCR